MTNKTDAQDATAPKCPDCNDLGWVVGYLEGMPAYKEPCPNPECPLFVDWIMSSAKGETND